MKAGTKRDAGGGDSQNRLGFSSERRGDETSDRVRFKIHSPKREKGA